ncbi:hypothetical protein [Luteibacter sp. 9145]|uniref:hypothetical protein n=1 Tax=Luteibacter sp. 9145 TaxID=1500892 RepID=UPI0012E0A6A6|nr:hypothetical protein [Luteibacter sp. 9145]
MNFFLKAVLVSGIFFLLTFIVVLAGGGIYCIVRGVNVDWPLFRTMALQAAKSGETCGLSMFVLMCLGYYGRDRRK